MQYSRSSTFRAPARRLVLGAAFALGLGVALIPHTEVVLAAGPVSTLVIAQAATARSATPGGAAARRQRAACDMIANTTRSSSSCRMRRGSPGLVFVTVLLVFLIPLLIIVLLIWYKIRKNRMANETMLKLAERGVVPPAAAMALHRRRRPRTMPTSSPA